MNTVTAHVTDSVADALLYRAGWTKCEETGSQGPIHSWTRPGLIARADGGQAGADYLWATDEALSEALVELAA